MSASLRWTSILVIVGVLGAGCNGGEDTTRPVSGDVTGLLEQPTTDVVVVEGGLSRSNSDRGEGVFDVVLCDRVGPRPDVPDVPPLQCLGSRIAVQDEVGELPLDWQSFDGETVVDEILTVRGTLDGEVFLVEQVDIGDQTFELP